MKHNHNPKLPQKLCTKGFLQNTNCFCFIVSLVFLSETVWWKPLFPLVPPYLELGPAVQAEMLGLQSPQKLPRA